MIVYSLLKFGDFTIYESFSIRNRIKEPAYVQIIPKKVAF